MTVAENTTAVTTVVASDADADAEPLVYSIVGGADATLFGIDATGALSFAAAPDYEADGRQRLRGDGAGLGRRRADTQTLTVTVTNANDNAPVITSNGGGDAASVSGGREHDGGDDGRGERCGCGHDAELFDLGRGGCGAVRDRRGDGAF